MISRVHLFIYGDVIGVGFRSWIQRKAKELGLSGFVRNFDHKTVEVVLEGEKEKIKKMIMICHKGPDVSWVEKVEEEWGEATGNYLGFEIKY